MTKYILCILFRIVQTDYPIHNFITKLDYRLKFLCILCIKMCSMLTFKLGQYFPTIVIVMIYNIL